MFPIEITELGRPEDLSPSIDEAAEQETSCTN